MSESKNKICAIILAAGKGTRMKSDTPKVLHPVAGKPILSRIIDTLRTSGIEHNCLVLGGDLNHFDKILTENEDVTCVIQNNRLGTGDAVASALVALDGCLPPDYTNGTIHSGQKITSDYVLITAGDTPALSASVLKDFIQNCLSHKAKIGVIGMLHETPFGYGRLIVENGTLDRIVEEKDASPEEKEVNLCNSGVIFAETKLLNDLLQKIDNNNAQSEYYLTDCFQLAKEAGENAFVYQTKDFRSFDGVNNRSQLCHIEEWVVSKKRNDLMTEGVTFKLPQTCYIEEQVSIGRETVIGPNCSISGSTKIGENCRVGAGSILENQKIESDSIIAPGSVLIS